ncbi:MAG TPA: Dna2/Cas4 domain-containing protein [Candidatus Altiarchaeales archaeon]|nr:Dna2/Cas4 domain-containing protein [Candidatus Altiarchaeales archaeon]
MINVSDLNKYSYCPRRIYLENNLQIKPEPTEAQTFGILGHAVRKEFSLRQSKIIKKTDSEKSFKTLLACELESILKDAPIIYKDKLPKGFEKAVPQLKKEMRGELKLMEKHFQAMIGDMGIEKTLDYLTPWKVEYSLTSQNLDMTGRIDKIYRRDITAPVELKTGTPSESVWPGDRLQLTAYIMMLEEKIAEEIPYGFIEYTRILEQKPVNNTEKTRREVIYARDEIQHILDGHDPGVCPHGNHRKCAGCQLEEICFKT